MDSQFKQRLTGAVILILLAVLLVPELLTGPKTPPPGPSASTPAQGEGAPLRSYDIDLSDTPATSPVEAPATSDPLPSPAAPAPMVASSAPAPPRPAPATTIESPPASRPERAAPAAASAPPPPAAAATAAPAMRGFAVQVGSFASRDTADRLAADLARRRFETFVSPVRSGGRQLYRVRVGPVADRAAAQTLQGRLKSAGQKGRVVTLP